MQGTGHVIGHAHLRNLGISCTYCLPGSTADVVLPGSTAGVVPLECMDVFFPSLHVAGLVARVWPHMFFKHQWLHPGLAKHLLTAVALVFFDALFRL